MTAPSTITAARRAAGILLFLAAAILLASVFARPVVAASAEVAVENAWSRASIGSTRPGVAYMDIRNEGPGTVALIRLRTDLATMAEVHRTTTDDRGVSSMTPAGEVLLEPGETVALEPGGLHVMLIQLQRAMLEGESFPLSLIFSDGGEVTIDVPVLGIAARGPED